MGSVMKPRILSFNPVRHAIEAYGKLATVAQTEVIASKSRAEFFEDVKGRYKDNLCNLQHFVKLRSY
jgi:glyoxylate reductase